MGALPDFVIVYNRAENVFTLLSLKTLTVSSEQCRGWGWQLAAVTKLRSTHVNKLVISTPESKHLHCAEIWRYLSDLRPLVSLGFDLVDRLQCLGILVRLVFSFPLSHSLSDVRSMLLLAFCTITTD